LSPRAFTPSSLVNKIRMVDAYGGMVRHSQPEPAATGHCAIFATSWRFLHWSADSSC